MIRLYETVDEAAMLEAWYEASLIAHHFLSEEFFAQERVLLQTRFWPNSQTWVCELEDIGVVGFLSMVENEVGGLFVHPRWHRRGAGRALMDKACSLHEVVELEVLTANGLGRAFYVAYGFVPISEGLDEATGQPMLRLRFTRKGASE